ncbi:MAG: hypothetical protein ABIJ45_06035 [Candidatus Zixiibacteriota bacterium]
MYNNNNKKRGHAVALFSGGLDSILSVLLVMRQNIEVTAITFMTHFGCDIEDRSGCGSNPYPMAEKFGFNVKLMHLGQKFIDIVKAPKHGYGKNLNPCIDCRLLMLSEAKLFKEMIGADFVITGEVLGQRPKSQRRDAMMFVDRKSGLDGYLVRPLSAKLFPETMPEKSGLLDRNLLENITGRSRKRQMQLAKEFGVTDYPSPAGGCLLTEPSYTNRLRDLMHYDKDFGFVDLNLLRQGRHFRLSDKVRIIVGRNEKDNDKIESMAQENHLVFEAREAGSPITILIGEPSDEEIKLAAAITARYSSARNEPEVEITYIKNRVDNKLKIEPADPEEIEKYQIK